MERRKGYDYDAIIIGSGIGGLLTGAYLAEGGAHVLICEQHVQPGGCFTSFKQKGYTFDGGTH
jgi:prolycopene isomerase